MTAAPTKKRSRGSCSTDSFTTSVNIMPPPTDKEAEYERAVEFLRNFHSRRVAALCPTSRTPLGAISEVGIGDLVDDFSEALQVEPSKTSKASPKYQSSPNRTPRMKKAVTSTCLLDLASSSSADSASSSSTTTTNNSATDVEKVEDDSSLFSLHQQVREEVFSESYSTSSGYYGLHNKRHCSNLIR